MINTVTLIAVVGALSSAISASAQLALNFDIDNASGPLTYSGVGVAPDLGTTWNSLALTQNQTGSVTIADAVDSGGNLTGVSVVLDRNGGEGVKINVQNSNGNPNPSDLMSDYAYWSTYNVTLSGLAAGTYDFYGFGHGDQIDQTATFTWGTESASTTQTLLDFRDIFQANAEGNTYVKLTGTVDGSGVLAFEGNTGSFNGFQIYMVPEPTTFALAGFGLLSLVLARRRR